MGASFDPYRRYKPIGLGIHVCGGDDATGEPVTVRNHDLPSPELARLRFEAARGACRHTADDGEVTVELITGGTIIDSFPMRRDTLPTLSAIVDPPPSPIPGRYRAEVSRDGRARFACQLY